MSFSVILGEGRAVFLIKLVGSNFDIQKQPLESFIELEIKKKSILFETQKLLYIIKERNLPLRYSEQNTLSPAKT